MDPAPHPRVTPFGDAALLVDWGGPPNPATNARVHTLAAALSASHHPAVAALVPAYASLLITISPNATPAATTNLTALVARLLDTFPPTADHAPTATSSDPPAPSGNQRPASTPAGTTPGAGDLSQGPPPAFAPYDTAPSVSDTRPAPARLRVVPVLYGGEFGPDLEAVATLTGLTPEEVVYLHTHTEQHVYLLGFAPGFPYLGDLPPQLAVPRLSTPRQRVPAGSVAIAARQTGIYPHSTPGGWRILGRTPITLFDPHRDPPAYFAPGDRVRFHPIPATHWDRYVGIPPDWDSIPPRAAEPPPIQSVPVFEVLAPGLLTTIQDVHGRVGYQHYGVATAGALDAPAAEAVNRLLGNHPNAPLLEITAIGPTLRCLANTRAALAGADLQPRLDNHPVPANQPFPIRPGQTLKLGPRRHGARAYLAIAGGFAVPLLTLGSAATDLHAGFGGHHGRPLQSADLLHAHRPAPTTAQAVSASAPTLPPPDAPIRVLPGPHPHHFAPDALQRLCDQSWRITPQSNRMGYRLQGQPLPHRTPGAADVTTLGLPNGAIQVPGDGQPIVLLADHQPTGGYTVLACVLHADLPLLAQRLPGDTLRFELATLPESGNPLTP